MNVNFTKNYKKFYVLNVRTLWKIVLFLKGMYNILTVMWCSIYWRTAPGSPPPAPGPFPRRRAPPPQSGWGWRGSIYWRTVPGSPPPPPGPSPRLPEEELHHHNQDEDGEDLSIEGLSQAPLLLLLVPLPEEELHHHNQDEDGEGLSIEGLSQAPLLLLLVPLPEEELHHHNQDEDGEEGDDNKKTEPDNRELFERLRNTPMEHAYFTRFLKKLPPFKANPNEWTLIERYVHCTVQLHGLLQSACPRLYLWVLTCLLVASHLFN